MAGMILDPLQLSPSGRPLLAPGEFERIVVEQVDLHFADAPGGPPGLLAERLSGDMLILWHGHQSFASQLALHDRLALLLRNRWQRGADHTPPMLAGRLGGARCGEVVRAGAAQHRWC